MQTGSASGMQTMDAALAALVRAGKITQRVAERTPPRPTSSAASCGGGGFGMAQP